MPLYEYECGACSHRFEVIQKFSDSPIDRCPLCREPVRKLLSASAFQFKGTGWYATDYASKRNTEAAADASSSSSSDSSDSGKTSSPSGSSDSGRTSSPSGSSDSGRTSSPNDSSPAKTDTRPAKIDTKPSKSE